MLSLQQPHSDDPPDHMATQAEADREFVQNVAYERREQAWILSDRDVWYPNPAYRGPRVPHPESLESEFGEGYGYADEICLCGAPLLNGKCSVEGCACATNRPDFDTRDREGSDEVPF
jgi:hypothetical protein